MPRPDGIPYPSELGAFGPKKKRGPKPKPKPVVAPVAVVVVERKPGMTKAGKPDRRIRCTPAVLNEILSHITGGLSIESSCILAGISKDGLDKFLKRNPAARREFERAETEWEKRMVGVMQGHAAKSGRDAAWLLERRLSPRWAPITKTEHTGRDGGPMQILAIHKDLLARMASRPDQDAIKAAIPV